MIHFLYEREAAYRGDILSYIYEKKNIFLLDTIPFWARYFLKLKQLWLEDVLSKHITENIIILDAGCGGGFLVNKYIDKDCRIYGLDISFNYLKIAMEKDRASDFIQGDVSRLPFRDKSVDILICSEVLEHVGDPEEVMKEIKRVTKKLFISTVPTLPATLDLIRLKMQKNRLYMPGKGHLRCFQIDSYLGCLRRNGFRIKSVQPIGFLWWIFSWTFFNGFLNWKFIFRMDALFSNLKIFKRFVLDVGVVAEL